MSESIINLKVVSNSTSVKELRDELKQAKRDFEQTTFGTAEWGTARDRVNQLSQAMKQSGPNWESYRSHIRQARVEKRALNFAIVEVMHGFDGLAQSLGNITGGDVGSLKSLTKGLQESVGAGLGIKFGMEMMGESVAAFAGPVGIAVSALTLFGQVMGEIAERKSKDFEEAMKRLKEVTKSFNEGISKEEAQKELNSFNYTIKVLEDRVEMLNEQYFKYGSYGAGVSGKQVEELNDLKRQIEAYKTVREEIQAVVDAYEHKADVEQRESQSQENLAKAEKKHADEMKKAFEARERFEEKMDKQLHKGDAGRAYGEEMRKKAEGKRKKALGDAEYEKPETVVKMSFGTALQQFDVLKGSVNAGVESLSSTIGSAIGDKFASVFGGAKTVAGQFFGAVGQMLAELAAKIALSGFLNMIFPGLGLMGGIAFAEGGIINEPVLGVGTRSKQSYLFGEAGAEMVTPMRAVSYAQASRSSGMSAVTKQLQALNEFFYNGGMRVEHDAIVYSYEKGVQAREKRVI